MIFRFFPTEDGTIEIRVKDETGSTAGAVAIAEEPPMTPAAVVTGAVTASTSSGAAAVEAPAGVTISRLASQPPPSTAAKDIDDCFGFDEDDDAAPNVGLINADEEDDEGAEDAAGVL